MGLKKSTKRMHLLVEIGLFVLAAILIYQCIPTRAQFDRHFEVGKPWQYDLLTAPMDFPIYKTDAEMKKEQDSIRAFLVPYFEFDYKVMNTEIARLKKQSFLPEDETMRRTMIANMEAVYERGILSADNLKKLQQDNIKKISIIDSNRVAREVEVDELFTPITAYEYILKNCPVNNEKLIRQCNLNRFLHGNLILDKEKSDQAVRKLYGRISPTAGIVQTGERILDRGEIINYETYRILNSLRIESEKEEIPNRDHYLVVIGRVLLILGLITLLFIYLYQFRPHIYNSYRNTIFILMMAVIMILLASLTLQLTSLSVYIIPFAILPIIVRTFFDSRTGLFVHIIVILICSMMVGNAFEFIVMQIAAGMTAVSSLKHMNQRAQLIRTASLIFLTYSIAYFAINLMEKGSLVDIGWINFGILAVNSLLLLFAYGLIYIFEKLFGFLSDVTLVELSNVNTPLLMEFSEKAPGSFQHALQVSNLAVEAAKKINANVLLVRTGALYHDIGKLENPMLFIENQSPGHNPLSELPYRDAAQIVIHHVSDGVRLAQKNGLPRQIIDLIEQHHGKSLTRYFYNSYKNANPNEEVNEEWFRYAGPRPSTKEAAIIMMADAIEAASRTLKDYNEETIDKLVENLINGQIADGSFKNAPITFRQVEVVKQVFKDKLKNIYHNRITYPELKGETKQQDNTKKAE